MHENEWCLLVTVHWVDGARKKPLTPISFIEKPWTPFYLFIDSKADKGWGSVYLSVREGGID